MVERGEQMTNTTTLQQFMSEWRERNLKLVALALGVECGSCGQIGLRGETCDRCGRRLEDSDV